jgi:hypothetical protein
MRAALQWLEGNSHNKPALDERIGDNALTEGTVTSQLATITLRLYATLHRHADDVFATMA